MYKVTWLPAVLHVRKRRKCIRTLPYFIRFSTYLEEAWSSANISSAAVTPLKWIEKPFLDNGGHAVRDIKENYQLQAWWSPCSLGTSSRAVHRKSRYFVHSVSTRLDTLVMPRAELLRHTVNCMSVEKCVLRTEVFYHYFSMQYCNMQCTLVFQRTCNWLYSQCRSVEKLRTLHIAWLHRKVMVEDFRTQYAFFNGPAAIDCTVIVLSVRPSVCLSVFYKHFSSLAKN